jgi:2-dehydro-3-deoxygluconokinase
MAAQRETEVVTLGECLASFVAADAGPLAEARRFTRHIAGAEANVAVGLARLGHAVAYIGRVGGDGFGTAILRALRGEGVDVRHLTIDDSARTGVMFRERRVLGAMDVVYHRAGSAGSRVTPEEVVRAVDDGVFEGIRWLHLTGITPALSDSARAATMRALEEGRRIGATVSLDVNLRRRLWSDEQAAPVLRDLASRVDVVFGSTDELALVAGADLDSEPDQLVAAVAATGVVKLGRDGALGRDGEPSMAVPGIAVTDVVDPVGAGDAFCAGFIAGRLDGVDLTTALRMGNACGALAVAASGDQSGLPDRVELARLLAGAGGPDTLR